MQCSNPLTSAQNLEAGACEAPPACLLGLIGELAFPDYCLFVVCPQDT
jgi:hypothetical protein